MLLHMIIEEFFPHKTYSTIYALMELDFRFWHDRYIGLVFLNIASVISMVIGLVDQLEDRLLCSELF